MEQAKCAVGTHVYIRKSTLDDTDLIVRWRNSEVVRPYFLYQQLFTRESHTKWFKQTVETGQAVQFIICENATDRPLGSVYFHHIDRENQRAEYGIYIGEADAEGHGLGTETAKLALEYAFKELKFHKIMLRALADNERAIKSYQSAGFVKEAHLKDEVFIRGAFHDVVYMAIINPYC
ncbi:MAG: GNAT family protein [Lachnospiraceae bacterium]|nr:GNAT family protein [Lachnospiraceae bacterium]